ncbi:MAG: hypothetical protein GY762_13980 [Proteobacteria bacterium]|nr:hypothetical protein [Pseudomonadota bacterium]
MKKVLVALMLTMLFAGTVVLASKTGPIKDKHKGLTGLEGAKVNCAYCHSSKKANNPKTEGNNLETLKKEKYCAINDCHPAVDKRK